MDEGSGTTTSKRVKLGACLRAVRATWAMRVRDLGGADLTAYQPRKDARFALTLVEQLTACAETLRRLARHR
jgi:hypothetical protein